MSQPEVRRLAAAPLTQDAFAPFGVLPGEEGGAQPTADLEFQLDDGWVNFISHHAREAEYGPDGPRCDHLNRHDTHTQTLMPMDADAVLVVAAPSVRFDSVEAIDAVRAFVVRQHEIVHLHRGTWHWGPQPISSSSVRMLNVQGRGWPDDNTVAAIKDRFSVVLEVVA